MGSNRHLRGAAALLAFTVAMPALAVAQNQPSAGFGASISFSPSSYTPPGITGAVRAPLASQDRSSFGQTITFTVSAYTPPGIVNLAYSPLPSQDLSGFGEAIEFGPSSYTPPGIRGPSLDTASAL